jgi:hypothetical protein
MFGMILSALHQQKKNRSEEIKKAVAAALGARREGIDIFPKPLEVKPHTRMATHEELSRLEVRVMQLETKIEADKLQIIAASQEDARRIHKRLDDFSEKVLESIGMLRGELKRIPIRSTGSGL